MQMCKKCGNELTNSGLCINCKSKQTQINGRGKLILMLVGIGVILVPIILMSLFSSPPKKELKDVTNKEYNQFMKWDQEQKQKELENQKVSQ